MRQLPIALTSGTSDALVTGTSSPDTIIVDYLIDTTPNVFNKVRLGDVVVNTVTMAQASVVGISTALSGVLLLSSDIFLVASQGYSISASLALYDTTTDAFDGIKVGDVVVNTTTMAQSTVVNIGSVATGILELSSDIFLVASQGYSIFSPNDDTRGNVLMSIEGYIIAINDSGELNVSFSSGSSSEQQLYTPIGTPVIDSFLTKLYLRWLERLLVTNATSNRLDIPLNEFFNNSSNVPYYIKTITLT